MPWGDGSGGTAVGAIRPCQGAGCGNLAVGVRGCLGWGLLVVRGPSTGSGRTELGSAPTSGSGGCDGEGDAPRGLRPPVHPSISLWANGHTGPAPLWIPAFAGMTEPAKQFDQLTQVLLGSGAIDGKAKNLRRTSTWRSWRVQDFRCSCVFSWPSRPPSVAQD